MEFLVEKILASGSLRCLNDRGYQRRDDRTRGNGVSGTLLTLREGIEVGSTTIERIVQGRYEWRDMQYKKTSQNRVWDPGIT